jgi:hypothetical protein
VDKAPINDPKHWRERAEEARAVADVMNDEKIKKMMLRIAGDYDWQDVSSARTVFSLR